MSHTVTQSRLTPFSPRVCVLSCRAWLHACVLVFDLLCSAPVHPIRLSRYAKIDRPNKVVSFREAEDASGQLNSWAGNISGLLALVEQSCHLIAREEMIAKSKTGKR